MKMAMAIGGSIATRTWRTIPTSTRSNIGASCRPRPPIIPLLIRLGNLAIGARRAVGLCSRCSSPPSMCAHHLARACATSSAAISAPPAPALRSCWASCATKRGRQREREHWRALKHLGIDPLPNENRIRADLKRLARCVATCSDDTLRVLEAQTPWAGIRPALSSGMLANYIAEAEGVIPAMQGIRSRTPEDRPLRPHLSQDASLPAFRSAFWVERVLVSFVRTCLSPLSLWVSSFWPFDFA